MCLLVFHCVHKIMMIIRLCQEEGKKLALVLLHRRAFSGSAFYIPWSTKNSLPRIVFLSKKNWTLLTALITLSDAEVTKTFLGAQANDHSGGSGGINWDGHGYEGLLDAQPPRIARQTHPKLLR